MQLETKHFGTVEIDEKGILTFEEGLPGFEKSKKFTLLRKEDDSPFVWLQSVEESNLAFVMADPFAIKKDYDIDIDDDTVRMLGIESIDDVLIYAILVIPEDVSKMTMNLKAPIIINKKSGKGAQIILDTDKYSVRHFILEELQR